jgi:hypothetical protein
MIVYFMLSTPSIRALVGALALGRSEFVVLDIRATSL